MRTPAPTPRLTMKEIRARYPTPRIAPPRGRRISEKAYCVGGAFICALLNDRDGITNVGLDDRFPRRVCLALYLWETKPAYTFGTALRYARKILELNDRGNFGAAWKYLDLALTHKRGKRLHV